MNKNIIERISLYSFMNRLSISIIVHNDFDRFLSVKVERYLLLHYSFISKIVESCLHDRFYIIIEDDILTFYRLKSIEI